MTNTMTVEHQEHRRLQQATEWLLRLEEDDTSGEEIVEWMQWCDEDPANRAAFERLCPLWQAFETQARMAEALATARSPAMQPAWPRRRMATRWAWAAGVVLTLGALVTGVTVWQRAQVMHLADVSSLQTPVQKTEAAVLPDGSMIELGARSAVNVDFSGSERRIEMREGEALFTVKHDRLRPFVVRSNTLRIVAVGTQFNVLRAGSRIIVTVQEGAVRVVEGEKSTHAPAGYQVVYDRLRPGEAQVRMVDAQSAISWRRGRLEYLGEPLSVVLATANRYSHVPIVVEDGALGQLNYTGTLEIASLPEWLEMLPRIFPVRVDTSAPDRVRISPL